MLDNTVHVDYICTIIRISYFSFLRIGGLLSGRWTNYSGLFCHNRYKDYRRLGESVYSTKWVPWNTKPNSSPGHLNCHHPEELRYTALENCKNREAVCPLKIHVLHLIVGIILLNEENNLNGLLLHSEFGTLQYPLPSQGGTETIQSLAEVWKNSDGQNCSLWS